MLKRSLRRRSTTIISARVPSRQLLLLVSLLFVGHHSFALELFPYKMEIYAERYGMITISASGTQTLQQNDQGQWEFHLTAKKSWLSIKEQATFNFDDGKVTPLHYSSENKVSFIRDKRSINYDHVNGVMQINDNLDERTVPMNSPVYDGITFQQAMIKGLTEGQTDFNFKVVRLLKLWDVSYQVVREEQLSTPMGKIDTLVIEQRRGVVPKSHRRLFWLAKDYQWIPIRVEHKDGGKLIYRISAKSLIFNNQPITAQ